MEEKQLENNIIQENEKAVESSANNLQHGNNQQLTESLEEIANKKRVTLKLGDVIVPIALGILLIIPPRRIASISRRSARRTHPSRSGQQNRL